MAACSPEFEILKSIVGDELCRQIQDRIGGCKIYIPKDREARNRSIVADYNFGRGLSMNELTTKYDISFESIRKIVNQPYRHHQSSQE